MNTHQVTLNGEPVGVGRDHFKLLTTLRSALIAHLALLLMAAVFGGCGAPQHRSENSPALHRREVNQKNPEGKDLVMTFVELRRDEKTSTVKVTHESGASVPSIMFVVHGLYDIAQARGASHFINLKEWADADGSWMYLVGFAHDENVDPEKYFGLKEPFPADDKHKIYGGEGL